MKSQTFIINEPTYKEHNYTIISTSLSNTHIFWKIISTLENTFSLFIHGGTTFSNIKHAHNIISKHIKTIAYENIVSQIFEPLNSETC